MVTFVLAQVRRQLQVCGYNCSMLLLNVFIRIIFTLQAKMQYVTVSFIDT